jgi:hypothetical protein
MKMQHRGRPIIRARAVGQDKKEIDDAGNFDWKGEAGDQLQPLIANQGQKHLHAGQDKAGAHCGILAARPLVCDGDEYRRPHNGLHGEPVRRSDGAHDGGQPLRSLDAEDHAACDLPCDSIVHADRGHDDVRRKSDEYAERAGKNRGPERKAGSHGQAADQDRSGIDQEITDQEEEVRPTHCLEGLWNRLDAIGLNSARVGKSSFSGFHSASLPSVSIRLNINTDGHRRGWSSAGLLVGALFAA